MGRDYQINADLSKGWVSVSGIRSTGLTAATGIADYVVNDLLGEQSEHLIGEKEGGLMGVSECTENIISFHNYRDDLQPFRFDNLQELSLKFRNGKKKNGETYITFKGFDYRVSHPISSFGLSDYGNIVTENRKVND